MFKILHRTDREYPSNSFLDHLAVSALWSQFTPKALQYLFFIFSNIQVLSILFWGQFELVMKPNDNKLLQYLLGVFKTLATRDLLDSSQTSLKLKIVISCMCAYFLLFFVVLAIVVKNFCKKAMSSKLEILFITILGQTHLSIGFWISNTILLDILFSSYGVYSEGTYNLLTAILAPILIVLNYAISAFFAVLAYNPFVQSSPLSTHTTIFQTCTFLFKATTSVILTFSDDSTFTGWVFTILSLIVLVYQYYKLISTFPYFEHLPMQLALTFSSLFLSVSGLSLLVFVIDSFPPELVLYMEVFLMIMTIHAVRNNFAMIIRKYLSINRRELRTEQDVLKRVFALRFLFNRVKVTLFSDREVTRNELDFWGVWLSILNENDILGLKETNINEDSLIEDLRKYYSKGEQRIIKFILKDAIKRLKHSDKLKIMVCNLSLEYQEQVSTTLYSLTKLLKPKGFERIVVLKLHQKVQQKLYSFFNGDLSQEKTLDLKSYMDLEAISVNFLEMIYTGTKKFLSFWGSFKKSGTRAKNLYEINLDIEKNSENILAFWKEYIESNRVFANSLNTIYSIYLALLRNSPVLARKIIEMHGSIGGHSHEKFNEEGPLSMENLSSSNNITFYASMAKEKAGKILYVSPNTTELLGWTPGELEGLNVSILVPAFMQKRHDVALVEHLEKVSDNVVSPRLYKNVMTFVADKDGFKVPCYVYLSLYPYIAGELVYTAIVRLKKSETRIILVDKAGNIEGFTRDVAEHFDLDPHKTVKMRDICENPQVIQGALDNLLKVMNDRAILEKLGRTKTDQTVLTALEDAKSPKSPRSPSQQLRNVLTDFSADLSEMVNANFYSPHEHSKGGRRVFNTYTVHITTRKFWDSHFFVFKLKESVIRKVRASLLSPFHLMLELPEVAHEVTSESQRELPKHPKYMGDSRMKKHGNGRNTHGQAGGILGALDLDDTNSKSSALGPKFDSKVEDAVFMVPKDQRLSRVKMATMVFVGITLGILIGLGVKNNKALSLGQENSLAMDKSLGLLGDLCRVNKLGRMYQMLKESDLFNMSYEDRSRYQAFGLNVSTFSMLEDLFHEEIGFLNQLNNRLRMSVHALNNDVQEAIFNNEILIHEVDSRQVGNLSRFQNLFDLTTEIVVSGIKLNSTGFEAHQAMKFILDNTLNDILSSGQQVTGVLIENNNSVFRDLVIFIIIIIILMGGFSVLILWLNLNFITRFIEKRKQLINILERLEVNLIDKQMNWVQKFANILQENKMNSKKVNINLEKENFSNNIAKRDHVKSTKKSLDIRGINQTLIRFCFAEVLLSLLMFSGYVVIAIHTSNQNAVIEHDTELMMVSSSYFYHLNLLSTVIYAYVDSNGTSWVRNNPIKEEWELIFHNISNIQATFASRFIKEDDDIPLEIFFTENLCNGIGLEDPQLTMICNNIAGGALQKGLMGLNSFTLSALQLIKTTFDESEMNNEDKVTILGMGDLEALEVIFNLFEPLISEEFIKRVQTHVKEHYADANSKMVNIVVIYVVFCTIFGGLTWGLIKSKLEKEIIGWRKILRQIPYEIVSSNKMLRSYIARDSQGTRNEML